MEVHRARHRREPSTIGIINGEWNACDTRTPAPPPPSGEHPDHLLHRLAGPRDHRVSRAVHRRHRHRIPQRAHHLATSPTGAITAAIDPPPATPVINRPCAAATNRNASSTENTSPPPRPLPPTE